MIVMADSEVFGIYMFSWVYANKIVMNRDANK